MLKKQLLPFVRHSLGQIQPTSTESPVPDELVQRAIIKGFLNLDDSIVKTALVISQSQESLQKKVKKLAPAYSGSYTLLPGEEDIIRNGQVLGIAVSRAFGDRQWKWPIQFQKELQQRFYGPPPLVPTYNIQTPPYLTAKPVMTSIKVDPGTPSFLIMTTDGL